MRFLVLGGAGDMGSGIVKDLVSSNEVDNVIIGDINVKGAEVLKNELGDKVDFVKVNVLDRNELLRVIKSVDPDVVLSAVGPFYEFAEITTNAAIEAGYNYIDICDDYDGTLKAFELNDIAEKNEVLAINGLGWTPGISNILAKFGADKLDSVETIDISWVGSAADSKGLAVVIHVFHAVSGKIPQYENNKLVHFSAWKEKVKKLFPEEFGEVNVIFTGHPEPITIPRYISVKNVYLRGALVPEWQNSLLKIFLKLKLIGGRSRNKKMGKFIHKIEGLFRSGGIPKSVVRVDVSGIKNDEKITLTYAAVDRMYRLTGIPASIGAQMLARKSFNMYGVFAPEAVFNAKSFLDRLKAKNIRFYEWKEGTWKQF